MKEYWHTIKKCPLFDGIEETELEALLNCLGTRSVRTEKGGSIFREGDAAGQIGVLLSGAAQIQQTDYFGNRSILAGVEPGELFGEAFACAGVEALPVSVVAVDNCVTMLLNCGCITAFCGKTCAFHQRMIFNLMHLLATKNLGLQQRMQITSKRTTREKLMAYLLAQAKKAGSNQFVIPFDRQELADYLEVDRSGLSTEIGKLKAEGVLDCHRSAFKIL